MILRESHLKNPAVLLPILGMFFLADKFIEQGIKQGYAEGQLIAAKYRNLCDVLVKDAHRSFARGVNGQVYEMLNAETTQTWPDPRQLIVKNIAVWYAADDTIVPPDHGDWLAKNLARGRLLDVRKGSTGLGHFTWMVDGKAVDLVKILIDNTK